MAWKDTRRCIFFLLFFFFSSFSHIRSWQWLSAKKTTDRWMNGFVLVSRLSCGSQSRPWERGRRSFPTLMPTILYRRHRIAPRRRHQSSRAEAGWWWAWKMPASAQRHTFTGGMVGSYHNLGARNHVGQEADKKSRDLHGELPLRRWRRVAADGGGHSTLSFNTWCAEASEHSLSIYL